MLKAVAWRLTSTSSRRRSPRPGRARSADLRLNVVDPDRGREVRARPAGKLSMRFGADRRGDRVHVTGQSGDWLRIDLPPRSRRRSKDARVTAARDGAGGRPESASCRRGHAVALMQTTRRSSGASCGPSTGTRACWVAGEVVPSTRCGAAWTRTFCTKESRPALNRRACGPAARDDRATCAGRFSTRPGAFERRREFGGESARKVAWRPCGRRGELPDRANADGSASTGPPPALADTGRCRHGGCACASGGEHGAKMISKWSFRRPRCSVPELCTRGAPFVRSSPSARTALARNTDVVERLGDARALNRVAASPLAPRAPGWRSTPCCAVLAERPGAELAVARRTRHRSSRSKGHEARIKPTMRMGGRAQSRVRRRRCGSGTGPCRRSRARVFRIAGAEAPIALQPARLPMSAKSGTPMPTRG